MINILSFFLENTTQYQNKLYLCFMLVMLLTVNKCKMLISIRGKKLNLPISKHASLSIQPVTKYIINNNTIEFYLIMHDEISLDNRVFAVYIHENKNIDEDVLKEYLYTDGEDYLYTIKKECLLELLAKNLLKLENKSSYLENHWSGFRDIGNIVIG